LTSAFFTAKLEPMIPHLTGWLLLGLKILAATGFMAVADAVMLYAS